ncbi:MAG TPA: M36 family metallopeptidase, partial [Blastocatellia bacterium]|nr:M36 family metallopeptidase [Blastocatellia bacterium]
GDPTASPAGWVAENRTEGNNARVSFNPDLEPAGGKMIKANDDGHFDFPLDLTPDKSPLDFAEASATNLFYWVNFAHDRFYALGFTETARNFQADNFGRGGQGNDPVRAETLRGARRNLRNNAFFSPTLDGTPPVLAMLLWRTPPATGRPQELDSSYDAGVIIHEYTHGVSTRLTGTDNEIGLRNLQGRGMGEGWSDFFAISFLNDGSRPLDATATTGQYLVNRARGVRSYPYVTRFDVNPLTFADIQYFPEVHAQGEVWCNMLWEMRQELIARYGFEAGRATAERLVIDGLKMTPIAPLFTDARDAILLADRATNGGANQDLIWRVFARRGLGAAAVTSSVISDPPVGFGIQVTESYTVPPEVTPGFLVVDEKPPALAVLGENLPLAVADGDLLASESVNARAMNLRTGQEVMLTLPRNVPGRFTGSLRLPLPGEDGGPDASLAALPGDTISITYANARNQAGNAETLEARAIVGRRVTVYAEDFETGAPGWSLRPLIIAGGDDGEGGRNYWHITSRRAATLTHSLLFAKEKPNKSFPPRGSRGTVSSPTIDLRGFLKPSLEFHHFFSGLVSFDIPFDSAAMVALNDRDSLEDPVLPIFFDLAPQINPTFTRATVDLRFIENRRVNLSFVFLASSDGRKRKKLEGLYVDTLSVTAVTTQP